MKYAGIAFALFVLFSCEHSLEPTQPTVTSVTISPSEAELFVGDTLQFNAVVEGTGEFDSVLVWYVNNALSGNATYGTVTQNGFYTTPDTVPPDSQVTIQAISVADTSTFASALVTILGDTTSDDTTGNDTIITPTITSVTVNPSNTEVQVSKSFQFKAIVGGVGELDTTVTWYVNNIVSGNATYGTITQTGFYTAPDTVPVDSQVTVRAVSVADTSKSDSATVNITEGEIEPTIVSITISPPSAQVLISENLQFNVSVEGTGDFDSTVAWYANNVEGGTSEYGYITSDGFYTAPGLVPVEPNVLIRAVSIADTSKWDLVTVQVREPEPTITSVTVSPFEAQLLVGTTLQFTAEVTGTGDFNPSVSWHVNNVVGGTPEHGIITPDGLYTTPETAPIGVQAIVQVVSTADSTKSDSATVNLYAVTSIDVSPDYTHLLVGETVQFSVLVIGVGNFSPEVTWSVTYGTITTNGLYTAPEMVPPELGTMVYAVSIADSTKHDSTVVELFSIDSVSVSPQPDSIFVGYQEQFIAMVHGIGSNVITDVTWLVNDVAGGSERYGYIDESGFYTAPDTVPLLLDEPRIPVPYDITKFMWRQDTVVVTVKSAADPQNQDSASFFISSGILAMGIVPTIVVAAPNDTIQFTPVFYGDPVNTSVWWFIGDALPGHPFIEGGNEELGTISTDGLYIAPAEWPPVYDVWVVVRSPIDRNRYATGGIAFWSRP